MRPRVFITGSFVVGLTMRVPRVPVPGETLIGDSFHMGPGGKGSNQAVGAARLGAVVNLLACVGDDRFADMATDLYTREGLAMRHIHRVAGSYTAMGFVSLLPSGENWITLDMGANLHTSPAHVEAASAQIAASDIVMTQFEVPPDAVARTLQLGRAHGALTILNPAPARPVSAGALADVDLLTPNETEARILLGLAPDDPAPVAALAQELLGLGVGRVVVTLGAARRANRQRGRRRAGADCCLAPARQYRRRRQLQRGSGHRAGRGPDAAGGGGARLSCRRLHDATRWRHRRPAHARRTHGLHQHPSSCGGRPVGSPLQAMFFRSAAPGRLAGLLQGPLLLPDQQIQASDRGSAVRRDWRHGSRGLHLPDGTWTSTDEERGQVEPACRPRCRRPESAAACRSASMERGSIDDE